MAEKTQEANRYLTPAQAAGLIGCKPSIIRGYIATGDLRATDIAPGSRPRWRISAADWAEFIDSRSNRPAKAAAGPAPPRRRGRAADRWFR